MFDVLGDSREVGLGRRSRRPRLETLVRLRWLAVAGQAGAVSTVYFGLGFCLPLVACGLVVFSSAWVNVGLSNRFARNTRLEDRPASFLLAYDILQLATLLFLTGGLENPFAMLFLAPVMIAAVSLSAPLTAVLTAMAIVCATCLAFYHEPVPWYRGQILHLPFLYSLGTWAGIAFGASFTAAYAWRVAEEARSLGDALAATELVLAREQHLTQLDGLAAAAAHELGTPLATIKLVAKDLQKQFPDQSAAGRDLALLMQELERCRDILRTLASLDNESEGIIDRLTLGQLVEEVAQPQSDFGVAIAVAKEGRGPEPSCRRNPGILYGLGNLVENAIDFATAEVCLVASWTDTAVSIAIEDDGPGFTSDVLRRLGEPYLRGKATRHTKTEDGAGLGLGLFIAKTLLERGGASVSIANAKPPLCGARVIVQWQRASFEAGNASRQLFMTDSPRALYPAGMRVTAASQKD